ncbi:LacI family DNA-binding transcriptional regulator [Labrys monachus]|uniref:LacI family gluconate utilization system Gnt-I transcriptional repressor n=1 Tax=Labrys monachus TaxID=217067 RepID=A0ABU0FDI1_9HYPH|nr:LacI family DNA-binding transcriptional regulator [Labrys monachus]MDQ0392387.1 LacI family gluconate utilization system Gnt-I transcriptional repressor [Labrys monachus]
MLGGRNIGGRKRSSRQGASVTLAEVAELAEVSEITVSRILRNKGPVAEATRKRVMAAVEATGYVPNRLAGGLASAGSGLIGVIVPSLTNIVFPEVLRGIHAALDRSGLQPVVGVTGYDMEAEEHLVEALLAWKPQAMVIAGFDHTERTRRMLQASGVRIAEVMEIDSKPIDIAVGLSHRQAGFDTGRHLIERGYRRFGYVGHDWCADRRARLRYDGLAACLAEHGLGLVDEALFEGPSSTIAGRDMLARLLARQPDIDVVVFSNDDMATGGVFHCIAASIRLKEDVAIFGFNGLDIGQALPVPLSTIRSNRFLIGRTAIERILERHERPEGATIVDTGYEIVIGGTA